MSVTATARERIASKFAESVYDNPVVTREFRTRMRGRKAFVVMGAYVLFLAVVMLIAMYSYMEIGRYAGPTQQLVNRNIGMKLFATLTWTQTILLMFIIPSLTSGALTQEIEKKTIEMLALSRLSAGKIVLGKQLSGFLYTLILLVCSVPVAGMCIMFGGISPLEVAVTYILLATASFLFNAVGVMWSSLYNRTSASTLFAYGTCGWFLLVGSYGGAFLAMSTMLRGGAPVFILSLLNPGWAPYGALMSAKVCGISIPIALAAALMHVAIGSLLLMISSTHVKYRIVDRALSIRLLLLGLTVVGVWMLVGNISSLGTTTMRQNDLMEMLSIAATMLVGMIGFGAAIFATGEVRSRPDQTAGSYAMSPGRLFSNDLAGGISFLLLWAITAYGTFGATIAWAAKAAGPSLNLSKAFIGAYAEIGLAILAITFALGAFGILMSSMAKQRRNAAALVILILIVMFAGYGVVMAYYQPGISNPNSPVWSLAALWPMTPVMALTNEWNHYYPPLPWRIKDSWLVTGGVYIALGVTALYLASLAARKYGGVREEY